MNECVELISQCIILPETSVDELSTGKLLLAQLSLICVAILLKLGLRRLPFLLKLFVAQGTKANTPSLKDDYLDRCRAFCIDSLPFAFGLLIAGTVICRFVVAWDFNIRLSVR